MRSTEAVPALDYMLSHFVAENIYCAHNWRLVPTLKSLKLKSPLEVDYNKIAREEDEEA